MASEMDPFARHTNHSSEESQDSDLEIDPFKFCDKLFEKRKRLGVGKYPSFGQAPLPGRVLRGASGTQYSSELFGTQFPAL
eukprot:CAMPEP_0168616210 /NCGR_PEP_ID=MMETSP0449_2-20121227/4912_1 /TAXON_ID=1082188 /ORGANISM="Strombidium rassoulzadegani, Strain ras09" /LENGTH=80 /DNA_ID=CAMNT_0008656993 /DNA_START=78 /DNA_END=320 /DNA_ORIENTATION=-